MGGPETQKLSGEDLVLAGINVFPFVSDLKALRDGESDSSQIELINA